MAVLTWFGVGRVPLSILFMVLFFAWGAIGFMINNALKETMGETWQVAAYSLPAAAFGSLLLTRIISRLITRFLPLNETYARRRHDLLGSVGEAIFDITSEGGLVSIRDERGNLFQVPGRVGDGVDAIPKGSRVKLVTYNGRLKLFFVIPEQPVGSSGGGTKAVA